MDNIATDAPELNANDFTMAKHMADLLHTHYPGHLWAVTCDGDKGIATVRNLALSGAWGYVLKLPLIYSASEWDKRVMRAGGEILERFRIARRHADAVADQIQAAPRNFAGHLIHEVD